MTHYIFPKISPDYEKSYCLTLYDWPNDTAGFWRKISMGVFDVLDVIPTSGFSTVGGKNISGSYKKIIEQNSNYLQNKSSFSLDITLRGGKKNIGNDAFPSSVELSILCRPGNRTKLCIAVNSDQVEDIDHFLETILELLIISTGPCYGGAFCFPSMFGPSFYLSSISILPRGFNINSNMDYSERLSRWRNSELRYGLGVSDGYFREIYKTNLLTERHLKVQFRGRDLRYYAETVGDLHSIPSVRGSYRWNIDINRIDQVRNDMEYSGLILSSTSNGKAIV